MTDGAEDAILALGGRLAEALTGVIGPSEVSDLRRLTGGASRETWSLDASTPDGTVHELVLRRDPDGRPSAPGAVSAEAEAMRLALTAGLPVPAVLVHGEEPAPWGGSGMVMTRMPGEALARRILRDDRFATARTALVGQCAEALARLHRVDPDELAGRAPAVQDVPDPIAALLEVYDGFRAAVPTFELAFDWLSSRRPPARRRGIVHGDFRLGNLLVDPDGLRAVLDWELVHLGDPTEDLGWFCVRAWRFGEDLPVGGLGTRDQLLDAYLAAGGPPVEPSTLHWWEVFGTLRWGVICLTQSAVHLRGELRSVELATIGRRVCEVEWDLLELLHPDALRGAQAAAAARSTDDGGTPSDEVGLHGRPTSEELVEAVRGFLTEEVMVGPDRGQAFRARVASNALAMVERELRDDGRATRRRAGALARIGVASERELAELIRADGSRVAASPDLVEVLAEGVVDRLTVANPRYVGQPG